MKKRRRRLSRVELLIWWRKATVATFVRVQALENISYTAHIFAMRRALGENSLTLSVMGDHNITWQ